MTTSMNRVITLDEAAGTAVLERFVGGKRRRVLDTKTVDARALLPSGGALYALPPRCRFHAHRDRATVFVTEHPPEVRTIRWDLETDPTTQYGRIIDRLGKSNLYRAYRESRSQFKERLYSQRTFRLAFPYVIEIFLFDRSGLASQSVFYRTAPLSDEHDTLCYPNLPNLNNGDLPTLCIDHEVLNTIRGSFAEMIAALEHSLWASRWNSDLSDHFHDDANRISEVASPWEWEVATRRDPRFVLRLPWRVHEKTIGDTMLDLLETQTPTRRSFHHFAQRIAAADPLDHGTRVPDDPDIRRSTAHTLVLQGEVLHVGDEVQVTRTFRHCPPGTYRVEWFYLNSDGSDRRVKLSGVEAPVLIIRFDEFCSGVTRVPSRNPGITVGGVAFKPDTLVRFHGHTQWPNYVEPDDNCSTYQKVITADRGPDGEALLLFENQDGFTVVGLGENVLPGVEVFSPCDINPRTGLIRAKEYRLPDGTLLRVGEYLFNPYGPLLHKIVGFTPPTSGLNGRCARLKDESGDTDDFQIETDGAFESSDFMALGRRTTVARVRIGNVVIRRGSRIHHDGRTVRAERLLPAYHNHGPFARIRGTGWIDLQEKR